MSNTITINLGRERPIFAEFGKRAYVVRIGHGNYDRSKTFTDKCPACDDTRKVTVRGIEMRCSYCTEAHNKSTHVTVQNYVVEEYIVNSMTLTSTDRKNAYDKNGPTRGNEPRVQEIIGFCRTGNGYDNVREMRLPIGSERIDHAERYHPQYDNCENFAFTTKAKAQAFCDQLVNAEKEKLAQFNELHGTNHQWPF